MTDRSGLRIAIDATAIPLRMAGAGVYTYELVRALAETAGERELTVFARPDLFDDLTQLEVIHVAPTSRPARLIWEQTRLPWLLRRKHIDVVHSPHHHTPYILPGIHRVVTFHDVTFTIIPGRYPLVRRLYMQAVTRASARVAATIITPSEAVRIDVAEHIGVDRERIVPIPEAAASRFSETNEKTHASVREKHDLGEGYILSVGTLEPGKNRGRLIRAYHRLRSNGVEAPLVIVGQPGWHYESDYELVRDLGLQNSVRFLGYVANADMPGLYAGASLLAFPSLYEGFGLPVLEAMASGTPVITSRGSAMSEVAEDAALLVDPLDTDAIADAIGRVLSDVALRSDLRSRGSARAGQFSWQRTALETLAVYDRAAQHR